MQIAMHFSLMEVLSYLSLFSQLKLCTWCILYLIQNSQAVKIERDPQKGYGEKRCEIQGGGQEMAVMVG